MNYKSQSFLLCIFSIILLAVAGCAQLQQGNLGSLSQGLLSASGFTGGGGSGGFESYTQIGQNLYKASRGMTDEQEYYLGRGVAAAVLAKYPPLKDANLNRYVNKVGQSIALFSDRPYTYNGYRFQVLASDEINAVSAPGGFVFVSRGFLKILPDEDALAAVLAHEVAHVTLGHGNAAISQSNLTSALTLIGKEVVASEGGDIAQGITTAFGDSITEVADSLLTNGYSRGQEYEADQMAAELLQRAGYNQQALVTVLDLLEKSAESANSSGWFSTHPNPDKRRDEVLDEVKIVDSSATADGKKAVQTRATRFKAATGKLG